MRNRDKSKTPTRSSGRCKRKAMSESENGNQLGSIPDAEIPAGKSQKGVNKVLRRSSLSCSSEKKEENEFVLENDLKTNEQEVLHTTVAQDASKAEDCCKDDVGSSQLEGDVGSHKDTLFDDVGSHKDTLFDDEEDMNDSDWEDGSIPKLDPVVHSPNERMKGLTIEFDEPSGSAGRKPVRRASAEDKELAELVHNVHLLCLLARGRLVDNACDDSLIQASLLSLLPTDLLKISEISNITANALSPLVTWFHNKFHVRSLVRAERSFRTALAIALETHEGTPEEIAALSVALFRALKFTARYCMKWYKIAPKRVNSVWWDSVLAPLRQLESGATGGTIKLKKLHNNASDEQVKIKASEYSGEDSRPNHVILPERSGQETSKEYGSKVEVESSVKDPVATRSSLEDMELETRALTEPLPTNQQAYKNHALYALERWLTKYQILHPKGPILGFCSGHPVYPRTSVQNLKTRERWLREGLQIKGNEIPAKILKRSAKLKKARVSEDDCDEIDSKGIELYGKWQLEPLRLPHAVDGIVPKNERSQVEVWSEKSLPPGTVHLRLPRVFAVAKRLEIDYAPAMVGFEFRNGHATPVFDGIVVCTEFKDAILEAYAEEEERRVAEEKKRNEAQAISRWYQLLSSIITRQKLNSYYGDGSSSHASRDVQDKHNKIESTQDGRQSMDHLKGDNMDTMYTASSGVVEIGHEHVYLTENESFDVENSVRTKRCECGFSIQVEEL